MSITSTSFIRAYYVQPYLGHFGNFMKRGFNFVSSYNLHESLSVFLELARFIIYFEQNDRQNRWIVYIIRLFRL